jgi:non-canonical (house-cleaning) NTP pyrophosphatase
MLASIERVGIGSACQQELGATEETVTGFIAQRVLPRHCKVTAVEPSSPTLQLFSSELIMDEALRQARRVASRREFSLSIAMESGLIKKNGAWWYETCVVTVVGDDYTHNYSSPLRIPNEYVNELDRSKKRLMDLIRQVDGNKDGNVHRFFSKGLISYKSSLLRPLQLCIAEHIASQSSVPLREAAE